MIIQLKHVNTEVPTTGMADILGEETSINMDMDVVIVNKITIITRLTMLYNRDALDVN